MTNKHCPTRGDLLFRFWFSLAGFSLLIGALVFRGIPQGPAGWEVIGLATLFFGGTLVWTLWKLIRRDHSECAE
ncbi:hypothetical protein [uncultured Tateyamaria sp.]|uniref:hypothetical protein n=1 Tax=uncultured Tateyamaria sp. TaxID=455651 RepID=UPI00262C9B32|nr:hypothetical protein [uncultured Tateyamaria sp.]